MPILSLALKSLFNRRVTAALTVFTIAISVTLLLGVEKIRTEAKASFANTISGTDLIVGPRTGATQLLLYSIFRIGSPSTNISWESYRAIADDPQVAWTIPLMLGDSHRGFRVLGTSRDYFEYFRHSRQKSLAFAAGGPFADIFDAVLGATVAERLGYRLDDPIVVQHGLGSEGFASHEDKPFRVAGILARTGTPVDRTVHLSLEGIEAMHADWRGGAPVPGLRLDAEEVRQMDLGPTEITAFLVGLKSKRAIFAMQRRINDYRAEPLLAVVPGLALQELWSAMGTAEAALSAISVLVVATGLLGMLTMLLSSLNERRREMAILRSVGARPAHVFGLFALEATLLTVAGAFIGLVLLYLALAVAQPVLDARFGLHIPIGWPTPWNMAVIGLVIFAGFIAGAVPAFRAYRQSLADGMMVRT